MKTPREPGPNADGLALATEVFVRGFGFTRSFTHPFSGERVGPLWVLRDAPRKNPVDYRTEEWVATDVAPAEVDRLARAGTRGRFAICAIASIGTDDGPLRAAYKALGYRLGGTEPLMVHDLRKIPRRTSPAVIERVRTIAQAERLAKAARSRQILPEHLGAAAPLRAYVATIDGEISGWVRSVAGTAGTWCSNMYVEPPHRRQGIASALLARMLRDDRAHGAPRAVLLASHTGAKLYITLGYRQLGTLLLFTPKR